MKRNLIEYGFWLVLILATLLAGRACGQDLTSWDMDTHLLTNEKGDLVILLTDPANTDSAFVLRRTLGEKNVMSIILIQTDGVCKQGIRDVLFDQSIIKYTNVPCSAFKAVSTIYRSVRNGR